MSMECVSDKLVILDAGSQYGKLIDRRVRELNVESTILPLNTSLESLGEYKAIIITGGPRSVVEEDAPKVDPGVFELGKPVLGICYGMQLMGLNFNVKVGKKEIREDGRIKIKVDTSSLLFDDIEDEQWVLLSHGDSVYDAPEGWRVIGYSDKLITAIESQHKQLYGVQFHPEVDLTENGTKMFANFLFKICNFSKTFTILNRESTAVEFIRQKVRDGKHVMVFVSGGVDSILCAILCRMALGSERVHTVHVDTGFMRHEESGAVKTTLEMLSLNPTLIDAGDYFSCAYTVIEDEEGNNKFVTRKLCETINPEEKRKIIGDAFLNIIKKDLQDTKFDFEDVYLAQGTLRPDLIESANIGVSSNAHVIKTHHNDTNIIRKLRSKGHIIEPLSEYHKDEVRQLARVLNLSEDIVNRHPFPGPGLAIRIICADSPYMGPDFDEINSKLQLLFDCKRDISLAFPQSSEIEQIRKIVSEHDIGSRILPIRSVGVQGDGRSYKYVCVISGNIVSIPWDKLFLMSIFIPKVMQNVNRVIWAFGPKIENDIVKVTTTYLTKDVVSQLRRADHIVNESIKKHGLIKKISQFPVISIPISFEGCDSKRSIVLRPFISNDFMTGRPVNPAHDIEEQVILNMVKEIIKNDESISRVLYDLTSKPPGTTEWE